MVDHLEITNEAVKLATINHLLPFIAASTALALSPGPDNLFVLAQSAQHGKKAGLLITLGLCTGLLLHISIVALGLAAIVKTSAFAFRILQLAGALYLLWLARGCFFKSRIASNSDASLSLGNHALYVRGVLMNVTNPKVVIFFMAFLTQFTDPAHGSVPLQITQLGLIFLLIALVIFSSIAIAASRLGGWLKQRPHASVAMECCAGLVFIGLAARLIFMTISP
jgi:threonine/homoserine/homoserine lactone efflux protein